MKISTAPCRGRRKDGCRTIGLFVAVLLWAGAGPAVAAEPGVVPPGATLDRLFDGACVFTEGVVVSPTDGSVYFSDITATQLCKDPSGRFPAAGTIWKYDPARGTATVFRSPSGMANGMKFDADGNLVVAEGADFGGRRITRTDMKTGKSYILTGLFDGAPYNAPNDLAIDRQGRIYFTDPRNLGWEPVAQPGHGVYRIDPDGTVVRLIAGFKPNGVLVSPDQRTLYVTAWDNGFLDLPKPGEAPSGPPRMTLHAYDLGPDGTVEHGRMLVDWSPFSGGDGMAADTDGNLYVAVGGSGGSGGGDGPQARKPGVRVYTPQGREIAFIATGDDTPTNVAFGYGADANRLYVTAGRSLYAIRLARRGHHPFP